MATHATDREDEYILKQNPDGTWRRLRRVEEGFVPWEEVPANENKAKELVAAVNTAITNLPQEPVAMLTKTLGEINLKKDDDDRKRYELNKLKIQRRALELFVAHMKKRETDHLYKIKQLKDAIKELEELDDARQ